MCIRDREYHASVSASITEDSEFASLLWGVWDLANTRDRLQCLNAFTGAEQIRSPEGVLGDHRKKCSELNPKRAVHGAVQTDIYSPPPVEGSDEVMSPPAGETLKALHKLRQALRRRGTRGIFSLGKIFWSMDRDRSDSIEYPEFAKGLELMQLGLVASEAQALFKWLDHDHNNSIDYNEFLAGVRGPMSASRRAWIHAAFSKIDVDNDGVLTLTDLQQLYDASQHPSVLKGDMTQDQVLLEFIDTFGDSSIRGNRDGEVTIDEFSEYYANVGASMVSDEQFGEMMRSAWKLGTQVDNYAFLRRSKPATAVRGVERDPLARAPYASEAVTPRGLSELEAAKLVGLAAVLDKLRSELAASTGVIALVRQLREAQHRGSVPQGGLEQLLRPGEVGGTELNHGEISLIWESFGGADSSFDLNRFAHTLQVHLNPRRKEAVRQAFESLDQARQGWVPVQLLSARYQARMHPEVVSRKLSEAEARSLFENGFLGSLTSQYVHFEEWERLYSCLLYTSPSPRDRTRSRMPSSA
eukprot:TRINITY_DN22171_c0_g1_i1.p1 TRINITY_DN22171_c0_g1~~TRINITY_DN22171_c0_g1_i1.p1  ORF type:complete len:527 (+),score=94.12 TRINITY_DN22171_c0_g1_i1:108-1688(+)